MPDKKYPPSDISEEFQTELLRRGLSAPEVNVTGALPDPSAHIPQNELIKLLLGSRTERPKGTWTPRDFDNPADLKASEHLTNMNTDQAGMANQPRLRAVWAKLSHDHPYVAGTVDRLSMDKKLPYNVMAQTEPVKDQFSRSVINVNPKYANLSDKDLHDMLLHELTHSAQMLNDVNGAQAISRYDNYPDYRTNPQEIQAREVAGQPAPPEPGFLETFLNNLFRNMERRRRR